MGKTVTERSDQTETAQAPAVRGHFAIYPTPDGGFVVAARLEGEPEDRHIPIPPRLLKMVGMLGGKSPLAALQQLMGGGK